MKKSLSHYCPKGHALYEMDSRVKIDTTKNIVEHAHVYMCLLCNKQYIRSKRLNNRRIIKDAEGNEFINYLDMLKKPVVQDKMDTPMKLQCIQGDGPLEIVFLKQSATRCKCGGDLIDFFYSMKKIDDQSDITPSQIAGKICIKCCDVYIPKQLVESNPDFFIQKTNPIEESIGNCDSKTVRNQKIKNNMPKNAVSCYVIEKTKKARCKICGKPLHSTTISVINKKGKKYNINPYKCGKCDVIYFSINLYLQERLQIDIEYVNKEVAEALIKKYEPSQSKHTFARIIDSKYEKQGSSEIINYCMCEIINLNTNTTFQITINNYINSLNLGLNRRTYPAGSEIGNICLTAVANKQDLFEIHGEKYKMNRFVRYDIAYIEKYAKMNSQHIINVKNNQRVQYHDKMIYVYFRLNNYCMIKNHAVETITMHVQNVSRTQTRDINIFYCKNCEKYWVNYEAMEELFKNRFFPALNYYIVDSSWGNLKPASKLMMYGYNVKAGGMSDGERNNLLVDIIENELMSKAEIIRNIESKVTFNGKKAGNETAKAKWQKDIEFVSQYVADNTASVTGHFVRN